VTFTSASSSPRVTSPASKVTLPAARVTLEPRLHNGRVTFDREIGDVRVTFRVTSTRTIKTRATTQP
jgi:hypothetical protein